MNINIFLMCYNESILLPHTIKHYKKYIPSCKITIYDNESNDNSVEIAKSLGCNVISWSTNNILNEFSITNIKNNCWKNVKDGWIIVADMDEYLCVTESELIDEFKQSTSILQVKGIEMIGESKQIDLMDIDLEDIKKYKYNNYESKNLCFLRENIEEMNYNLGAHCCNPTGVIKYSYKIYFNKHMNTLGEVYLINKMINRYERSELMRKNGISYHYINDLDKIKSLYYDSLNNCNYL